MFFINWFKSNKDVTSMKRFIELIQENHQLEQRSNDLYRALRLCGDELYKRTGNMDHLMPEYWLKIVESMKL